MMKNTTKNLKNNFIELGKIVNTHGIKGEVRVLLNSIYDQKQLDKNQKIYFKNNDKWNTLNINSIRLHKNFVLFFFKEFNNINQVEFLKGKEIFLKTTNKQNQLNNLLDFLVKDKKIGTIGKIKKIINIGPYKLLIINYKEKEINIPYIEKFITNVDEDNKDLYVNIPKEFIE